MCQVNVRPEQVERIALDLGRLASKWIRIQVKSRATESENNYITAIWRIMSSTVSLTRNPKMEKN